jgi:hypothetical protein
VQAAVAKRRRKARMYVFMALIYSLGHKEVCKYTPEFQAVVNVRKSKAQFGNIVPFPRKGNE